MTRTILERKPYSSNNHDWYLEIVLAKITNTFTPYVTWLYNKIDSEYYEGHYFKKLDDAKSDYHKRR